MILLYYGLIGVVGLIIYSVVDRYVTDDIIKPISDNTDTILTVGKGKFPDGKITVDMNIDSHVLIIGLSNCRKSKLAEGMLRDKSVTIVNTFPEDFPNLNGNRITGEEKILNYLEHVLDGRTVNSKVYYLLIDEIACINKE